MRLIDRYYEVCLLNSKFGIMRHLRTKVCLMFSHEYVAMLFLWLIVGHFGCVYNALLIADDKTETEVAVKTMRIPAGLLFAVE